SRAPAWRASASPLAVRSTSVHPVNRFWAFQVDSPWRIRTRSGTPSSVVRPPYVDGESRPLRPWARRAPGGARCTRAESPHLRQSFGAVAVGPPEVIGDQAQSGRALPRLHEPAWIGAGGCPGGG